MNNVNVKLKWRESANCSRRSLALEGDNAMHESRPAELTKFHQIKASTYKRTLYLGLTLFLCVLASPGHAEEISLSVDFLQESNSNTEIKIQNTGDRPATVHSIVINRKEGDEICHLRAFQGFNGEHWFARSDSSDEELAALSMERLTSVTLRFGDEVDAMVYRGCGSILEVEVWVDEGRYLFRKK